MLQIIDFFLNLDHLDGHNMLFSLDLSVFLFLVGLL